MTHSSCIILALMIMVTPAMAEDVDLFAPEPGVVTPLPPSFQPRDFSPSIESIETDMQLEYQQRQIDNLYYEQQRQRRLDIFNPPIRKHEFPQW
jgi:hypothetical protein